MQTINQTFVSIIKQICFLFFMSVSFGLCAEMAKPEGAFPSGGLPFAPGDIPDLTEEERAAFELIGSLDEKELGQLMQEIEKEFEKLSDEEKQKMLGEIDKEAQRLQGKIDTYYSDQGLPPMAPTAPVEIEPTPKPQSKPTPKPKPEVSRDKKELLSKRIKVAEALIARVLQVIEKYIITGQTIPDFDDQIEQWGKEEKIKNWKRGLNWVLFKGDIDNFVRKLHKIKDRDSSTKQYKYLEGMVSDESLYNNLGYLDEELQKYGSAVQGISLETGLLPPQAETAIQEVTGLLAEALYQLHIPAGLDKAIEPYQKIAADMKIKQEEYEKQAYAESQRPKPSRPVYVVGDEPEQYGGISIPATPAIKRPAYRPPTDRQKQKPSTKASEKKPDLLSGAVGKGAKKAKSPEQKTSTDKKKTEKKDVKEDKASEGFIQNIATGLTQAMSTLDREFKRIKQDVTSKNPVNQSLVKSVVPKITQQVEKAAEATEFLNSRLKGKILSKEQKEFYANQLKNELKAQRKEMVNVSNQLKQLRRNSGTIPAEKAYSYFGGERAADLAKAGFTEEQIKALPQTNLGDLEGALDRILAIGKKK